MGDPLNRPVVIVGTGQAAVQTALTLRDEGFEGEITLIGDEPDLPYQRPPLSKAYLLGKLDDDGLALKKPEVYKEYGLRFLTGVAVTKLDRERRCVILNGGGAVPYESLVIATGARPRRLGIEGEDLDGVLPLRTVWDARMIAARLPSLRKVVVVGAGFIGLEFAAVARAKGLDVTIVELGQRVLGRAVSEEISEFFLNRHMVWGTHLLFGVKVDRIEGGSRGQVQAVVLSSGVRLEADLVVVGVGVQPNLELARDAGLQVADGIVVDRELKTSDPAIWAAGDCAVHPNPYSSTGFARLESVQNATDQGRVVAYGIVGRPQAYEVAPWFWSDQGDLKLQIAGLSTGYDRTVVRGEPASGAFSVFCFKGDRLLAVESVNRGPDHILARRLLHQAVHVTPEAVADEGRTLKSMFVGA
jgi:3-phenylpropionate/trans-cinnamate dioxygenase ferredoxin reductase subunit